MCGIFGVFFSDSQRAIDDVWLQNVTDTMKHRGPDSGGVFSSGPVGLGHRRLSIIDVSEMGRQPMFNEDNSIALVFNGEIYNYQEIRKELIKNGHKFISNTDSEVIIHLYEEIGAHCVEKLQGMFSFILWDNNKKEMFIARDRVGIKPLYYSQTGNGLVVASEIKAILASGLTEAAANCESLDYYLSLGWVPGEKTFFKGIYKLEPGHHARVSNGTIQKISQYWSPANIREQSCSFEEGKAQLAERMEEVIKSHLVSDVPVGAFLSGGVDSSTIVAYMTKILDRQVMTFSVGFKDGGVDNELPYARTVAERFNTEHHEFILDPLDFFEGIDQYLNFSEEPVEEPAGIALYQLSMEARKHAKVLLSGEGMDEVLAGYPLYPKMLKISKFIRAGKLLPIKPLVSLLAKQITSEKVVKYLDWVSASGESHYQSGTCRLTPTIKERMYNPDFGVKRECETFFNELGAKIHTKSELRRMEITDIMSWLPNGLLLKADRLTMAASIELRVPFLDHTFMEFCLGLPDHLKLQGDTGKFVLKKLMENMLPDEILYRKKQGFTMPISQWFKTDLYEQTCDVLLDKKALQRGFYRAGYVEKMLKTHRSGKENMANRIFILLCLEMWHRKYIDQAA